MEISYYNDAARNSLVVRCEDPRDTEGYQVRMISCNRIPGLLPCSIREIDGDVYLAYDVTGLQSLQRLCGEKNLEREQLKKLLYSIAEAGKTLSRYLLDFSGLVFSPELIFYDYTQDRYFFLYYPGAEQGAGLASLLQYAEKKIRPGQKDLPFLLYRLLDLSENPNFILKQEVLDRIMASSAAGAGADTKNDFDREPFYRTAPEQNPEGPGAEPHPYRWQQETETKDRTMGPCPEPTQQETAAQQDRKEAASIPAAEKKAKEKKEAGSKAAGTFLAAVCLLLAAIGTELVNLYLPVPEGAAVIVRALLLGFLVAAVVIAAYGTMLSFKGGKKEDAGEMSGQIPPIVPAGAAGTPAAAGPSFAAYGWQSPQSAASAWQSGENRSWGSAQQQGQSAQQAPVPRLCGVEGASMFSVSLALLPCTVGSDAERADCVLPDPSIGRIHARISQGRSGELLLTDSGSRFGTFLNGVRLMPNESMALQRGDQVRFGNLSFVFR